jgi:hypothetical protein
MTMTMNMNIDLHEQILGYIDHYLNPFQFYEILEIKTDFSINLISRVMKESHKTIPEAVLVFITVVKSLWDRSGTLQEFIKDNWELICKTAIEKKAQGNLPGRALPLFEIFEKKIPGTPGSPVSVIELGASYGIIGGCLLNLPKIMKSKDAYFPSTQQMPELRLHPAVEHYLGIELSPPDKEWVLAWEWYPARKQRLKNFLADMTVSEKFKLLKANAFGFAALEAVKDIVTQNTSIVVLTSFMLYQYEDKKQKMLRNEILEFTKRVKGHWINQTFDVSSLNCYIEFDEEKIIELADDGCKNWQWLI